MQEKYNNFYIKAEEILTGHTQTIDSNNKIST